MLKIKYETPDTNRKSIIFLGIFSVFFSFPLFISIASYIIDSKMQGNITDYLFPSIFFAIIPILIFIVLIIKRNSELKAIMSQIALFKVIFNNNCAEFIFTQEKFNFTCNTNQIKNLEMILNTSIHSGKSGSYAALDYITLNFNVADKNFSIPCIPDDKNQFIYKLLDNTKQVQNFEYHFNGPFMDSIDEQIKTYKTYGAKPILTKEAESSIILLSAITLAAAIVSSINHTNSVAGVLVIISFIMDIYLLIDKIHENKYKHQNKNSSETDNKSVFIPIGIIAVKIIVISIYICYFKPF